jgi:uncharacterized membrane protein YdbT with pleckstrin-like domain
MYQDTKTGIDISLTNTATIITVVILIEILFLSYKIRKYKYTITNDGIHYTSGVLLTSEHYAEFECMTDVRVTQDFFEGIFGIHSIEIDVSGIMGATKTTTIFDGITDVHTPLKIIHEKIEEKRREIKKIKKEFAKN